MKKNCKVRVFSERNGGEVLESSVYHHLKNLYNEMRKELESAKQEIRNLKQCILYTKQMKSEAERQATEAMAKGREHSRAESILKNKLEEVNEEHVLVQLAMIEAWKESQAADAERDANAALFSRKMTEVQNKISELLHEVSFSKDLEASLRLINSEIEVLQNELKSFKAMEKIEGKAHKRAQSSLAEMISRTKEEDLAASAKLALAITELNQAQKELQSLREEGLHVMTSMDIIRNDLKQTSAEMARSKGLTEQSESKDKVLNSKLLKAKQELEIATKAEENPKSILSHLLAALAQLKNKADAANTEKKTMEDNIANLRSEIQANGIARNESEQRLQSALQDLEETKAAEMIALENFSILSEKATMARAASSQLSPYITISKFEFEYLMARAGVADEIANKKVAAAKASANSIRSAKMEIITKTGSIQREIAKIKMAQEQELDDISKTLAAKKVLEAEVNKLKIHHLEKQKIKEALPNEQIKVYGRTGSVRKYGRTGLVRESRAYMTHA